MQAPFQRRFIPTLIAGILLAGSVSSTWAAEIPPPVSLGAAVSTQANPGAAKGTRTYRITLKELGAQYPLNLEGVDGSNGVPFSIRADEVVTAAKLNMNYAYSPALMPDLSHINVMVNGEVAFSIPVPKEDAGKSLQRSVDLPVRLISDFNQLNLQLIGHYTMGCEDPLHSSLWANVANDSVLELTVAPLTLQNDLSLLPLPFFDRRDVRTLNLPFVMIGQPDQPTLEAAGTMASWLGGLAAYRGSRFPVSLDAIPARGNAVVFLANGATLAGLDNASVDVPTVSIVNNPNDPNGKLLLIKGQDTAALKVAAAAVSLGTQTFSGQTARILKFDTPALRQPYDAPNWLRSDRPVKFGELVSPRGLNVAGYRPDLVRVDMRMPPDLFLWRNKGVPVDLKYRYTPRPTNDKSTLNVNVNQRFLKSIQLQSVEQLGGADSLVGKLLSDDTLPAEQHLQIPLFMLPPRSQLQMHYYYDYLKQGECRDVIIDNVRGAVDPDSTIDLSGFSHFAPMPNLASFDQAGYPFTRLADLSQTAVILPEKPTVLDYSAYLALMGRMGESSGYPATAVTVVGPDRVNAVADKDLLVIGSGGNQPLLTKWAQYMPGNVDGKDKHFNVSDLVYRMMNWGETPPRRDAITLSSDGTDAMLAGFESPLTAGRSVVVVAGNKPQGLENVIAALLVAPAESRKIEGSLALVHGKQVDSLLAEETYYVGYLPPLQYAEWYFSRHVIQFLIAGLLGALLLAALLYRSLHARAKRRLKT
jgi:hypothetical protein